MTTTVYKRLRFPAPAGLDCDDCGSTGVSGELYETDTDGPVVLLMDTLCRTCYAGRDPDYDPSFDYDDEDHLSGDDDPQDTCAVCGEVHGIGDHVCMSCQGRHYNLVQSFRSADDTGDQDRGEEDRPIIYLVMPCGCAETLLEDVPADLVGA